jgi:two-component system, OmpR family, response regulator ResD
MCDGKIPDSPELILVADDDEHIVQLVELYLRRAMFDVATAADGDEALLKADELHPALLVLDVMMPGQDGLQICRTLRHRDETPVILLTARSSDFDRVAGLRFGADDYVTKPFNPDELVARVQAVLRRSRATEKRPRADRIALGGLQIDATARSASGREGVLALTPREFALLAAFARSAGVVLGRSQLRDLVWGTAYYSIRTVDVHVARLRQKIKSSGVRIDTVWGAGYRMSAEGIAPDTTVEPFAREA